MVPTGLGSCQARGVAGMPLEALGCVSASNPTVHTLRRPRPRASGSQGSL